MKNTSKSTMLSSLITILSFFCIGLGLISVIASNWQQIPESVKLAADILLLAGAAAGIFYAKIHQKKWLNPLIVFDALLILASIGLIAQVFQLSSHSVSSVAMLWSLLTLPLLFLSSQMVLPFFWIPMFSYSVFDIFIDPLFGDDYAFRMYMLGVCWLFVWALLYRVAALCLDIKHGFVRAFRFWIVFNIAASFIGLSLISSFWRWSPFRIIENSPLYGYGIVFMVVVGSGIIGLNRLQKQSFLLPAMLGLLGLYNIFLALGLLTNSFFSFLFVMAALTLLAFYAYRYNRHKLLTASVIFMAIRIFILFLELFGSLMNTGIILIFSGIFLIASIQAAKKLSSVIAEKKHE